MVNRWTCLSMLCLASLHGWGPHTSPQLTPPGPPIEVTNLSENNHFPLNLDQQWYFKAEYLLWKAQEDDVDYGNRLAFDRVATTIFPDVLITVDNHIKVKKPTFEWSSGVRVALGKYLPHHQQWDISAIATYFYNNASDKTSANFEHNEFFEPAWDTNLMGLSPHSSVHLKLNFFTWDLLAGREYLLTPTFAMHPFIGVRGTLIEQHYLNRNLDVFVDNTQPLTQVTIKTKFKADNEFWGVGPRIGTDLSYSFGHGWSLLGSLSGSFLYGHYTIHEKLNGFLQVSGSTPTPGTGISLKIKDKDPVLRSNLEASFGLGWEKWVHNHTVRIAPSIVIEGAEWFSMNHWLTAKFLPFQPGNDITIRTRRHYGNLAFWGFNFNLQCDF